MTKFKVGDRVMRLSDVYDQKSPMMHGVVTEVATNVRKQFGFYNELYSVKWDSGKTHYLAYLPHGLSTDVDWKAAK